MKLQDIVTSLLKDGYAVKGRGRGGSMWPTITNNQAVVVRPLQEDLCGLKEKVVAIVSLDDKIILHRLACVEDGFAVTKSDFSVQLDKPVPIGRVIGVVELSLWNRLKPPLRRLKRTFYSLVRARRYPDHFKEDIRQVV